MTLSEYSLLMEGYALRAKDDYRQLSLQAFRTAEAMNLTKKTSFSEFVGESDSRQSSNTIVSETVRKNK